MKTSPILRILSTTAIAWMLASSVIVTTPDSAKAPGQAHRHTKAWEIYTTWLGFNQTREGLHFRTLAELQDDLKRAGFSRSEVVSGAVKNSNTLIVATV